MDKRTKELKTWLKVVLDLKDGKTPACPDCGGSDVDYGYIVTKPEDTSGYGAIWCNDCRHAFWASRVILKDSEARKKIVHSLPEGLIYT